MSVAVGLLLLQIAIRLPGIGAESLWWDEASTAMLAVSSVSDIMDWSATRDQTPPLYFLTMAAWAAVFGISEYSLRAFSLIAASLTGVVLYRLARRHYGQETALYAFLGYAGSGLFLYYAHEARAYALVALVCAVSYSLFLKNFDRPQLANSIGLAAVNTLGAYLHYTILFPLLAQFVAAFGLYRRERTALKHYVASQLVAAALFLPWVENLRRVTPPTSEFWAEAPSFTDLLETVTALAGRTTVAIPFVVLSVIGLTVLARGRTDVDRRKLGVLLLWIALPILTTFAAAHWVPVFGLRYLVPSAEGMILLLGVLIAMLPVGSMVRLAVAVSLTFLAWTSPPPVAYVKSDWRGAAASIENLGTGRTTVIVSPAGRCLPLAYYLAPARLPDLPSEGLDALADDGILCVVTPEGLPPLPSPPPETVIQVLGRGAKVQPRELMATYAKALPYDQVGLERLSGVVVVPFRRSR